MNDLSAKVAYIKGLMDGIKFEETANDTNKIIKLIVDLLSDITEEISSLDSEVGFLEQQVEDIEDDLSYITHSALKEDEIHNHDEFEVVCPGCGESIVFDIDDLDDDITCPHCGEEIEFDFDCDCEDCK